MHIIKNARYGKGKTKMKPNEWFAARPVCTDELDTRAEEAYQSFLGFAPAVTQKAPLIYQCTSSYKCTSLKTYSASAQS